jgi:hypothetical protein
LDSARRGTPCRDPRRAAFLARAARLQLAMTMFAIVTGPLGAPSSIALIPVTVSLSAPPGTD